MKKRLLDFSNLERIPLTAFTLGAFFALIGFATSTILFKDIVGVATVLFTVIISFPIVSKIVESQTKKAAITKEKGFLKKNEAIIDFYLYLFLGIFVVYFLIGLIYPGVLYGGDVERTIQKEDTMSLLDILPALPGFEQKTQAKESIEIFQHNLFVMIVAFILSLLYGSGALFLVALNASVFAAALSDFVATKVVGGAITQTLFTTCSLNVMFIHTLPELGGYILAAIGGSIIAKGIFQEGMYSAKFSKVVREGLLITLMGVAVLFVAGFLEVFISKNLFQTRTCARLIPSILFTVLLVFYIIIIFFFYKQDFGKKTLKNKQKKKN